MPHGPNSRRKPQPMTADDLMTAEQAATLKRLTRTEADSCIVNRSSVANIRKASKQFNV